MINQKIDKSKMVECHHKIAEHYRKATDLHDEAAKYHNAGNHEKAIAAAHLAHGHVCCAQEHTIEAAKHCAGIECEKERERDLMSPENGVRKTY